MHEQRELGRQCSRFFDGNLFYSSDELSQLLRGITCAGKQREAFFGRESHAFGHDQRRGVHKRDETHGKRRRPHPSRPAAVTSASATSATRRP